MGKLKITIVTYSWPPRNSISTHRPYSWARYWSKSGEDVTVITSKKQNYDEPLDMVLPKLKGVKIIEIPYEAFFSRTAKILLKFSIFEKIGKWLRKKTTNFLAPSFDPRNVWSFAASSISSKIARESDIVISTYGPEASHIIASRMKVINPSIFWIADYRDLWSDNPNLAYASKKLKDKIRKFEINTVSQNADLITSVSDDMSIVLKKLHKKKTITMTNGFDIDEKVLKKNILKKKKKLNRTLRIVYTGTVYSKLDDPTILLRAINNLIDTNRIPKKSVTVDFYGSKLDHINYLSKKPEYVDLIRIRGHMPRPKTLIIQKKADILLLLASSEMSSRGVLKAKTFEYMAAGPPILCIGGRPNFAIGKVLKLTNAGLIIENHEIKKLEDLICETIHGEGLFKSHNPKINEILNFSRKRISENYLLLIRKILLSDQKLLSKKTFFNTSKICHIITGLERGGAERFLFNLLTFRDLKKTTNHTVISLMSEGYYGPLLKKNNISLYCLNMDRGQINIESALKLKKILKKIKPDLIQGWMYHGNLAALLGAFITSKKTKLSWNIRLSLEIFPKMKLKTRLAIRLGAMFSKKVNSIIYNSNRSLIQHRQLGFSFKNDYFIPNGFDIGKWKPNKNLRYKIRNLLGISNATKVIGYVGRGDKQKDLPTLFKVFEIIKKKHPDVILVAVGKNLKRYALNLDRIIFLGEREDVEKLMVGFDLLCLTSKAEGFPNVIGEAMLSGLPCISTDVGDAKEIVDNAGWIVPINNTKLFVKCLDNVLKMPKKEFKKYGKNARKKIVNSYEIGSIKNQYTSLYNSILNKVD